MEKTYVINCPICGASLTYNKDDLSTVCSSCKNTVYREKRPQDINLNLKYAIISDGSTFTDVSRYKQIELDKFVIVDNFKPIKKTHLDAISVSKIDSLVYELTINFSGDIPLDFDSKQRRKEIVDEILLLDKNNIYGRFLKDIILADKLTLKAVNSIFTRADALAIQDFILTYFPLKFSQDIDVIIMMIPMINFIMHTDLSDEDKFYYLVKSLKTNFPFQTMRPALFENEGPEREKAIIEGYKTLLSALIYLNVPRSMIVDTTCILRKHFKGLNNIDIIKLFINYILQTNLMADEKKIYIENFIKEDLGNLNSFNECYDLLFYINALGYDRYISSKLTQCVIQNDLPKNITFDGHAILNRFIKDSRIRFHETYCLYFKFSNTLFFKQMLVQVLYGQRIFDKDEMLLFIDCVRVFAKISLNSQKKLDSMQLNTNVLIKLGLDSYSEGVKRYHGHKIKTLRRWDKLNKNDLNSAILIEKKSLFKGNFKETEKDKALGDKIYKETKIDTENIKKRIKFIQLITAFAISIMIYLNFMTQVSPTMQLISFASSAVFYFGIFIFSKKKDSILISIMSTIGILIICLFILVSGTVNVWESLSIALFTLLIIPVFFFSGLIVFDPITNMLISKNKYILSILLTEDRKIRMQ